MRAALIASNAAAAPVESSVQAALHGPEVKKIKVFDHEFNIKPVEIIREGVRTIVNGQISHHLSLRRDDQVYYRIIKEGNRVVSVERDINRGGWAGLAAPFIAAAGMYFTGAPIPPDAVEKLGRAIGAAVNGSWESAADAVIANIALRVS